MVNAADGRKLDPLEAYEAVMRFAARRGEPALHLAMHAAMPQVLRPELVHQLRINFVPESAGDLAVEADVLFAPFCADLGNGYYQFDAAARRLLLQELDPTCTDALGLRSRRLAEFLTVYVDAQLRTPAALDPLYRDYLDVEAWVALGFLDPDAAAEQLAAAIAERLEPATTAARVQIGGIAGALTIPLTQHHRVVTYAEALEALDDGDVERGTRLFGAIGDEEVQAGAVTLPSPSEALGARGVAPVSEVGPAVEQEADVPAEAESDMPPASEAPDVPSALQATVLISCVRADLTVADRIVQSFVPDDRVGEVEVLPPVDRHNRVETLFSRPAILLQLISPSWPTRTFTNRVREFVNPENHAQVVKNIEEAFARGIPVVPVLIGGIPMPAAKHFPESVQQLVERQALALDEDSWERGIKRLVEAMAKLPQPEPAHTGRTSRVFLAGTADVTRVTAALADVLHDRGIETFRYTQFDAFAGEAIDARLTAAIERSSAFVVILAPASEHSSGLLRELQWAERTNVPILPVLIGENEFSGPLRDIVARWPGTRITESFDRADLHRVSTHVIRILNQRSGELRTESPKSAEGNLVSDLERLLGPDGSLISVPLEEFEQRRHQAINRLEWMPLPPMLVTWCLDSDVPVRRLIAYCQLQATPDPQQLKLLLETSARETKHARESRETRCLWNMLEALHRYRYTGMIAQEVLPAVIRVAVQISGFLSENDDLDPGRQCRISVQRLLELLTPPSA